MHKILTFVLLATFGTASSALAQDPPAAQADEDSPAQHMARSFKEEAVAMHTLAAAIKKDVAAGKVKVAAGSEAKWEAGSAKWAEIKTLADEGKKQETYTAIRELRQLFGETLLTGLTGKASKSTKKAAEAWWQVDAARAEHIVAWGRDHDQTAENKAAFSKAAGLWEGAKSKKAAKDFRGAFTEMLKAIDSLDDVMWNTWNAK